MKANRKNYFTREQLFLASWAIPLRTLSERLGISDVGLKKRFKRLAIPTPGRGDWAKVEAGKPVVSHPLGTLEMSDDVAELLYFPNATATELPTASFVGANTVQADHPWLVREREPGFRIELPMRTGRNNPLLSRTQVHLREQRPDSKGFVESTAPLLAVRVSKRNRSLALRVLTAILHAAKRRDLGIECRPHGTCIRFAGFEVPFRIEEERRSCRLVLRILNDTTHVPTEFRDSKHKPIGDQLNDFFVSVLSIALETIEDPKQIPREDSDPKLSGSARTCSTHLLKCDCGLTVVMEQPKF